MKLLLKRLLALVSIGLIAVSHIAQAQGASGPTDPKELEVFLDQFLAEQMEKLHIPGAVFIWENTSQRICRPA